MVPFGSTEPPFATTHSVIRCVRRCEKPSTLKERPERTPILVSGGGSTLLAGSGRGRSGILTASQALEAVGPGDFLRDYIEFHSAPSIFFSFFRVKDSVLCISVLGRFRGFGRSTQASGLLLEGRRGS